MQTATELLVWSVIAHLVADWMFQTEWMAVHKMDLRHPAAWTHAGVHVLFLWLVFPWYLALLVGVTHLLIDTRRPLLWWITVIKQMKAGPQRATVEIWLDQVFHIAVLALVVLLFY
ncbi:MAG: DUF3307 domain-containing protein [Caldilineaceae bacterium]|nr:DUF3307 domain-containing protein [Caldilineaceae bacterium]